MLCTFGDPAGYSGAVNLESSPVVIGIVTYNRSELLAELLLSVDRLVVPPAGVVIVDNHSTDDTDEVVSDWASREHPFPVTTRLMETNTGGSGGFSEVVSLAVDSGAEWVWLMDDDVEILPDALTRLNPWMARFRVLHGRRFDADGEPFYWQARFNTFLGVPLPYSSGRLETFGYALTDAGTFEGMLIGTDVVRKIGLPDPRFFITWDDAVYAWLAARVTQVAYVDEFVLRRKRKQRQISLGIRHLNDSSALVKYHMMRNRAYVGRYFAEHGRLNRFGFGIGTFLTFGKEVLRLLAVERSAKGLKELLRGWRDGRRIWADRSWRPMPAPLPEAAHG